MYFFSVLLTGRVPLNQMMIAYRTLAVHYLSVSTQLHWW